MKTKEELLLSVKEDIEAFGKDKLVYINSLDSYASNKKTA